MSEELPIPDWVFEVKAWFPVKPEFDSPIVREIIEHIRSTGEPHTWRGHTHTRPPDDAEIEYVGEFDLPKRYIEAKRFAPCPCCSPRHSKYGRGGKIAYFQKEQVIRLIGPDCFKSINEQGHREAEDRYHQAIERARTVEYLLQQLPRVPDIIRTIEQNLPIATAVDAVRHRLPTFLNEVLRIDLWEQVKDGQLKVTLEQSETFLRRDQSEGTRTLHMQRVFASIAGYKLLRPRGRQTSLAYRQVLTALKKVNFGFDFRSRLVAMADTDRSETARLFGQALKRATGVTSEIADIQMFFSPMNIANLKGWGRHAGSPCRFYFELDGRNVLIGQTSSSHRRFVLPAAFFEPVRRMPDVLGVRKVA